MGTNELILKMNIGSLNHGSRRHKKHRALHHLMILSKCSILDISEYPGYVTLHDIIECKHCTENEVFHLLKKSLMENLIFCAVKITFTFPLVLKNMWRRYIHTSVEVSAYKCRRKNS